MISVRLSRRGIFLGIITFLGILLILFGLRESRWVARKLYPIYYADIVSHYCAMYQVDPLLVTAIMRVESGFYPRAESRSGAKGLMQIMPETALWVAGELALEDFNERQLFDPEVNIMIGTWYLASLHKEFGGNLVVIIAAYNAGRGNVGSWLEEMRWSGMEEHLEDIPFRETRLYVKRVIRIYKAYERVYRGADCLKIPQKR